MWSVFQHGNRSGLSKSGRMAQCPGRRRRRIGRRRAFPVGGDSYLQDFVNTQAPPNFDFWVTTNAGSSWFKEFNLQFTPKGATIVPGPLSNPTVYQGFQEPGAIPNGGPRFGVVRATNLFAQATV